MDIIVLMGIILLVIIFSILTYFYYSGLKSRNCNSNTGYFGQVAGYIRSVDNSESFKFTLKDYYIKSAYNCCSGGSYKNDYVDTCILKNILKQGVRGLDFEIFSIDNKPVVATSTSDSFYVKETFNYIPFSDVMNIIRDYAFISSSAPNPNDPILIHLRIKSNNIEMYKNFAKLLKNYNSILLSKDYDSEYYGQNFGDVPLSKLTKKVIIIVDKSNDAFMECPEFYKFINITSNSTYMRLLNYYDVKYSPDMNELIDFNKKNMTIAIPDKGSNPENPSSAILRENGCQMLALRYNNNNAQLEENEDFFKKHGYAFVLKPENLRFKQVTIDVPTPQNPQLAFVTKEVKSDFYKFNI